MAAEKPFRHMTKKERKAHLLKRNKNHELLFQLMRIRRVDAERVKKLEDDRNKPRREAKGQEKEWSDKVATVRNRLTGKKRESKERWNRFAGTGDAGGRGL